ncbi:MAG: diaminopimelate epimerase [Xanthomonadaceae bacterium]|jgi:diaminopimelate epimerase|nr:diaminopimelate epimerase [Xanthomonadaceae bacterium]
MKMSKALPFTKMHGAGNDFVVLDLRDGGYTLDALKVAWLADRRYGIGCDQILTIGMPRSKEAVASYDIWNADGTKTKQCGNGARCVAAWLVSDGAVKGQRFQLDSPVGTHWVERLGHGMYSVTMGVPKFALADIPMNKYLLELDEYTLDLDGKAIRFGAVSMGNPHVVIQVPDVQSAEVKDIGSRIQRLPIFPESCNVGFVEVVDYNRLRLRVYERGAGETLACGSGACAATAVMIRQGKVHRDVTVLLRGGDLRIRWPNDGAEITMAGPAAFVFEGEWMA